MVLDGELAAVLGAHDHLRAPAEDGLGLLRAFEHGGERAIDAAVAREEDGIIEVEDDRPPDETREHPLEHRRADDVRLPLDEDDIVVTGAHDVDEAVEGQPTETRGLREIPPPTVEGPIELGVEERPKRAMDAVGLQVWKELRDAKATRRPLLWVRREEEDTHRLTIIAAAGRRVGLLVAG